ncbi:MAG: LTA synthase family protein [Flavobacteriales bacterium]|nr:LTA synthase family protein [Flavobacteriales bacterium]
MASSVEHIRLLLARLGIVLLLFTALRWVFYIADRVSFPELSLADALLVALHGARFDAMTVVVANAPSILLHLLPWSGRDRPWYQRMLFILYIAVNASLLLVCCIDLPFFGFNGKRLTRDVLAQAGAGLRELPTFIFTFWWATLVFIAGIVLLVVGWRRVRPRETVAASGNPLQWLVSLAVLGLLALGGRGGWQYQGLSPAHAADHVPVALAPLVTNSAFTLGYSLSEPAFTARSYLSPEELDRRMPLRYDIRKDSADVPRNVVLLIVESLGREYLSTVSGEKAYMPFMDSLCARSLVLTNAFANAERSNKSMCAILAGIPSFTEDAFMNTAYGADRVEGLGTRLKEIGYSTAFFHGGLNGEYKFDSFSKACGFDGYFGKDDFGDDRFYDGHWGIYDEEFLQFTAARLGEMPQPFCSVVFTLSSHDPFPIPARYAGRFPKGRQDIHESLGYVDMSLRWFFEAASKEPWYAHTLFVITGDHTYQYNDHPLWYRNPAGRFAVPILFFSPDGAFTGRDDRIAQHLDLLPSILDLSGYAGTISTFGQSVFRRDRTDRAAIFLGGQYRLIQDDRLLLFDGTNGQGLYDYRNDTLCAQDISANEPERAQRSMRDLQAIIQRHGEALVGNTLVTR